MLNDVKHTILLSSGQNFH